MKETFFWWHQTQIWTGIDEERSKVKVDVVVEMRPLKILVRHISRELPVPTPAFSIGHVINTSSISAATATLSNQSNSPSTCTTSLASARIPITSRQNILYHRLVKSSSPQCSDRSYARMLRRKCHNEALYILWKDYQGPCPVGTSTLPRENFHVPLRIFSV